jgi:hypothetical protein
MPTKVYVMLRSVMDSNGMKGSPITSTNATIATDMMTMNLTNETAAAKITTTPTQISSSSSTATRSHIMTLLEPVPAKVIPQATGQYRNEDIAILKISATEENNNLPTIPLGDEKALEPLDNLITVGFPGIVDYLFYKESPYNWTDLARRVEPSITEGKFSGFQPSGRDFDILQMSTPMYEGNSGGPIVDVTSGKVVGIATMGGGQGFNFAMPVSLVLKYLDKIHVQPQESQFTKMFRQALIEYDQHQYQKALGILQQINQESPSNPEIVNSIQGMTSLMTKGA